MVKAAVRVENAEMTPSSAPATRSGTHSIERMPSRSSTSRRVERGSVRTSSTRIAAPVSAHWPMIPSPTGSASARHSSLRNPWAAVCTRRMRPGSSRPMPQPVDGMRAVTARLIRSSTEATSSRAVMSWLVP